MLDLRNLERKFWEESDALLAELQSELSVLEAEDPAVARSGDYSNEDHIANDESAEELAARTKLSGVLKPAFATMTLPGLRERLKGSYVAFLKKEKEALAEKYGVCATVAEFFLFTFYNGELDSLLDSYRKGGLTIREDTHPIAAILRAELGLNPDRANRWCSAIRFALLKVSELTEIVAFMRANGGIEGCVEKFKLTKEPESPGGAEDATPTRRRLPARMSRDRNRTPGTGHGRSDGMSVGVTKRFRAQLDALLDRYTDRKDRLRVAVTGHVDRDKRLTLRGIRAKG
ncbi:MAG TPA: hypothetical protein VEK12_03240 [Alphaproteobacteria bacterium]|nr:hypothetical protein [Alphaproteobacteria bacterium]